jgi:UDP-N-acetylglucosamine--dolichyl-phosphate N-acetylglucosaminephosphotransferase
MVPDVILALLPLTPALALSFYLPTYSGGVIGQYWIHISFVISLCGYFLTNSLIKVVGEYNQRAGLSGKDMGKKGSKNESVDVPEALGLVPGIVFLMCTIFTMLIYAKNAEEMVIYNSALFSVCFMVFLGFTDDVLDLKWRYKLILPTVASLPLLFSYSGNTAMFIPNGILRNVLWNTNDNKLTNFGEMINNVAVVDTEARGSIVELGFLFVVFMGLLAVFCTNSINIMAGINGLEAGQSYIIAVSILTFKLYEMAFRSDVHGYAKAHSNEFSGSIDHQIFTILMILPFIGTTLALLKHNWYPAAIFVGDTYCYFAGMTFAVIGIHGHFSKTLFLLFLPQVYNFIISIPQVFGFVPCPRHRLPKVDPKTQLLHCSTFPCHKNSYQLIKLNSNDIECPNFTIICTVLRIFGPMNERNLTIFLLLIQIFFSIFAFTLRYIVFEIPVH